MRALLKLAATGVAAASLLLGTAVLPASAADKPVNVTSVKVKPSNGSNGVSAKTKSYRVITKAKISGLDSTATIYANVYRGSKKVKSKVEIGWVSPNYDYLSGYPISVKSKWGRGAFTLKDIRVDYHGAIYADTNVTGGGFAMKSAIDGKLKYHNAIQVQAKGTKKTMKIGLRCYEKGGWEGCSGKRVHVQYKTDGHWKTRKTVRLNGQGLHTYSFTAGKKYSYRIKVDPGNKVVGGTTTASIKI
ncbi:hypothetical protein [Isoptericola aurantiacus]|uniref:hypothetical protein n=1 Tax=Isoptericola aurantiacus TaxID=3377839 RepID=UPI00383A03D8